MSPGTVPQAPNPTGPGAEIRDRRGRAAGAERTQARRPGGMIPGAERTQLPIWQVASWLMSPKW